MIFGAHCSTAGGFYKALERAESIGADSCQLFVKNNMQWMGRMPTAAELERFKEAWRRTGVSNVFGHTGYLINLGGPPSVNRDKSLASLVQEIEIATLLGIPFLVLHPGAHLGSGVAAGIRRVVQGLNEVFQATKRSKVRIALENTAGQGTCLGAEISHLAKIYDGVRSTRRLGVCLDTAHFFAAGYDLRTARGWGRAMKEVETLLGCDQVVAFHLNDSKTELGSRVDRHAGIGEGHIGTGAFRRIVNDHRWRDVPGCLETPKSPDQHEDITNLAVLRGLVRQRQGRASPRQ